MWLVRVVDESANQWVAGQVMSRVYPKSCDCIGKDVTSVRGRRKKHGNVNECILVSKDIENCEGLVFEHLRMKSQNQIYLPRPN